MTTTATESPTLETRHPVPEAAIAVVGMACRVPGASNIGAFWQNLVNGVESIEELSDEELLAGGEDRDLVDHPDYVKRASALSGMALWDAGFFGLSPKEAAIMDPQHRHFLELCWEALETAGYAPGTFDGATGVFGGCGAGTYMMFNLLKDPDLLREQGFFLLRHIGNDKDFLATRVAYHFDLKGPALNIQTACSTSLAAIHLAVQSLLSLECDAALAGGVTITHPHRRGYLFREGEILSPDGRCRAFDRASGGTVLGDGAGVVVLRRLEDALADGDTVYAVIRGTAVNNDGSGKVGFLAPSVDGQARVVSEALAVADVDPATIGYVEAHGTGTRIGDPIEVAALTRAFRAGHGGSGGNDAVGYCGLGSVKTNIGHLDTAAGVAGFIKAVLALHHRTIPASLHFEAPNPELDLESSPFRVVSETRPFDAMPGSPRRAGVSSLGVGGTNVHVVLEEAPAPAPTHPQVVPSRKHQLLLISGRSRGVVGRSSSRLVDHLESHPELNLADVAWTLQRGRATFSHRRFLVAPSTEAAIDALVTGDPALVKDHTADDLERRAAFLFAGGGAQYPGMAAGLYRDEPDFRRDMDRGLELLAPELARKLRQALGLGPGAAAGAAGAEGAAGTAGAAGAAADMEQPTLALPALFLVQYAQARLWMSWGLEPSAMIGHSMGEYTAACLAGVLSLEEALELVVLRGELFERVTGGAMLGVPLSEAALRPLLGSELSVAAVNGPELCVASGPRAAIERLEGDLRSRDLDARRIHIDVAAHSAMLDPILGDFRARLRSARLQAPARPFISNLTGTWITAAEATDPEYWVRQLRETVRFAEGLSTLLKDPNQVLLEVGPGRTLATLARLHPERLPGQETLTSLRHPDEDTDDQQRMLDVLGRLWQRGVAIDWSGVHAGGARARIPLPTYPFEGERHLVEPPPEAPRTREPSPRTDPGTESTGQSMDGWLHEIVWSAHPLAPATSGDREAAAPPVGDILLLAPGADAEGLLEIVRGLPGAGRVHLARPGSEFGRESDGYRARFDSRDDMARLLDAVAPDGTLPSRIVHGGADFLALLALGQALGERMDADPVELVVLTRGGIVADGDGHVPGDDGADADLPTGSLVAGPVRVLPAEIAGLTTRWIDLETGGSLEVFRDALSLELHPDMMDSPVALRARGRLRPAYRSLPHEADDGQADPLPEGAVCVITGGTGGIGLAVARHLARQHRARLVLIGRTPIPPRESWPGIRGSGADPRVVRTVEVIAELEAAGAKVLPLAVDVSDPVALAGARDRIRSEFGEVDALIHAAGVLDDGLVQFKSAESAERVLAPKVAGGEALDRVFRNPSPGRTVYFSSVSAEAGLPGQVDYASANAFLDALARRRAEDPEPARARATSIGWGVWGETGMAVDPGRGLVHWPQLGASGGYRASEDFRFDAVQPGGPDEGARLRIRVRAGRLWMLDEHRTSDGIPLIPGAGFVELLRAAAVEVGRDGGFELEDLYFLAPFFVPEGETRELEIRLPSGSEGGFVVAGRGAPGAPWVEHVTGSIRTPAGSAAEPSPVDVEALRSRMRPIPPGERVLRQDLVLGPRWDNVHGVAAGTGEVLLTLELPAPAAETDLPRHELHAALLDNATALAGPILPGFGDEGTVYVPASFGSLVLHHPLPRRFLSHVALSPDAEEGAAEGLATLDVTLSDEAGRVLATAGRFVMVRVSADDIRRALDTQSAVGVRQGDAVAEAAAEGIPTELGLAILDRILGDPHPPAHVLVAQGSLEDHLETLRRRAATSARGHRGHRSEHGAGRTAPGAAPDVDVEPVERALMGLEAVADAAVTAHSDRPGEIRLVAHVVMDPARFATVSELRRSLREELRPEQVPQNFVELERLPRGADGRVRRAELRDPFAPVDDHVPPSTPTQMAIAAIWSDLLGAERLGLHDNFLDVGGHSLLAMRAILRIEKATGVRIGPVEISMFTLEQIASFIDGKGADAPPTQEPTPAPAEEAKSAGLLSNVRRWLPGSS